jgi:hypothetical protein
LTDVEHARYLLAGQEYTHDELRDVCVVTTKGTPPHNRRGDEFDFDEFLAASLMVGTIEIIEEKAVVLGGAVQDDRLSVVLSDHPKLTLAVIESLKNKGLTQSDIARLFGVTRQAVSWHKRHYGGLLTPREAVLQHFPWSVPEAMGQSSPYRRLRDHGEYFATQGVGMDDDKLARLRRFYKKLLDENLVVEFDPDLAPTPGIAGTGGFAFRQRRKRDKDLLIRVNIHTHLTKEGRKIWRLPAVEV